MSVRAFDPCPCGLGAPYVGCCGAIHRGSRFAETPERLMRARYAAFVAQDETFLLESWAPENRPERIAFAADHEWLGLTIDAAGPVRGDTGTVRFTARYRRGAAEQKIRETSRFRREDGRWLYVDGKVG